MFFYKKINADYLVFLANINITYLQTLNLNKTY